MALICHITTVHTVKDTRIYHKECRALAEAGHDVKLIAVNAQTTVSDYENVEIININIDYKSKVKRMLYAPKEARRAAEIMNAQIYHFHDPEFLFSAYKMAKRGRKVIYDAHEDVSKQILTKSWINPLLRRVISMLFGFVETFVVRRLTAVVTVVEGVVNRLKQLGVKTILVKNYPDLINLPQPTSWESKNDQLCYVGDFTRIRGIAEMLQASSLAEVEMKIAGRWSDKGLLKEIDDAKYSNVEDLGFVTKEEVQRVFAESKVGVILFRKAPNHIDASPNKLFEYLAAGLPVIASDFGWLQTIVDKHNCGVTVNPEKPKDIAKAMRWIFDNDQQAQEMGNRGREAVLVHYNWDTEKFKLLKLYEEILAP